MHRSVVVVSVDGLSSIDLPHLEALPNFRYLLEHGSFSRQMRGIYPTQTYPLHASLITGCCPRRHGVQANTLFQPGRLTPDWHWYRRFLKVTPLYELAARAGLRTATLLWPGAARSGCRYVIPEIKATRPGQCFPWLLLSGGSPLFILRMAFLYRDLLESLDFIHLDNFCAAVGSRLIRSRKTNLLLMHLLDLDGTRHRFGFRAPRTVSVLKDQDRRLGELLAAARDSGVFENTTFVVFGDHAYIDVHTRIRINAAFRQAGLLDYDEGLDAEGSAAGRATAGRRRAGRRRLRSWQAWANCCEGSAQVRLHDPADRTVHRRLAHVLALLRDELGVIQTVYGRDQIESLGLGDRIDYVLEARAGCYFVAEVDGDVVAPAAERARAAHGYHPDRPGYCSLFFAAGAGIRSGVELPGIRIVDLGPTLAALLGLRLPGAEGRVLSEILED